VDERASRDYRLRPRYMGVGPVLGPAGSTTIMLRQCSPLGQTRTMRWQLASTRDVPRRRDATTDEKSPKRVCAVRAWSPRSVSTGLLAFGALCRHLSRHSGARNGSATPWKLRRRRLTIGGVAIRPELRARTGRRRRREPVREAPLGRCTGGCCLQAHRGAIYCLATAAVLTNPLQWGSCQPPGSTTPIDGMEATEASR
jgi:hypothetical protein